MRIGVMIQRPREQFADGDTPAPAPVRRRRRIEPVQAQIGIFFRMRISHRGNVHLADILDRLAQLSRRGNEPGPSDILSAREIEVLQLMSTGSANKEIAASLSVSESTVKTHVANIFQKLDVNHRTEAVTQALQRGIIKL